MASMNSKIKKKVNKALLQDELAKAGDELKKCPHCGGTHADVKGKRLVCKNCRNVIYYYEDGVLTLREPIRDRHVKKSKGIWGRIFH